MAITLYTWPESRGTKVQWALEELGLPYQLQVLDRAAREHKQAPYLAIHPNGKVPALVDGDDVVFESAAILVHLGERYGVERGLWPAPRSAEALSWTVWSTADLDVYLLQYLYHGLDTPISYAPEQRSRATAEYNHMNHLEHIAMLEKRLGEREYLLGAFSLVDVSVAEILGSARKLGLTISAPRVVAWLERCLSREALCRAR